MSDERKEAVAVLGLIGWLLAAVTMGAVALVASAIGHGLPDVVGVVFVIAWMFLPLLLILGLALALLVVAGRDAWRTLTGRPGAR